MEKKKIPFSIKIGNDLKIISNLSKTVREKLNDFDFLMIPLVNPLYYRDFDSNSLLKYPLTYSGIFLLSHFLKRFRVKGI